MLIDRIPSVSAGVHAMRVRMFIMIGGAALLLLPAVGSPQQFGGQAPGGGGAWPPAGGFQMQPGGGGWGGRGGGGGGGAGGSRDPNDRWNSYTGGKPVWIRAEISDPSQLQRFDFIAQMAGATGGQITKEQYLNMASQMGTRMGRGGAGGPPMMIGAAPGAVPTPGAPVAPGDAPAMGGGGGWNMDAMIVARFNSYDKNGDGVLNYDEMPDTLRVERDKWDTNHDGVIDLNEFKEYARAVMQQAQADRGAQGWGGGWGGSNWAPDAGPLEEEDKKPVVHRVGQLPKELPEWFARLDTDKDAQVGLYEWKTSGMPLEEFQKMDRNGDGFLTVDEVLYYEAQKKPQDPSAVGGSPFGRGFAGGFPPGGFQPGGGFPQGGFQGGGWPSGGFQPGAYQQGGMSPQGGRNWAPRGGDNSGRGADDPGRIRGMGPKSDTAPSGGEDRGNKGSRRQRGPQP